MEEKREERMKEKKRVKVIHIDECGDGPHEHHEFHEHREGHNHKEVFKHFDGRKHHEDHKRHDGPKHKEIYKHKYVKKGKKLLSTKMFTSKEEVVKYVDEKATEGIFVEVFKVDDSFYKVELSERK